MHYLTRFTEKLLPADETTVSKAATPKR
jgi:hypothetical protein